VVPESPTDNPPRSGGSAADATRGSLPAAAVAARGISRRAVVIGLLLVVVVDAVALYADIIYNASWTFGSGSPCIAGLTLLLLLTAVNPRFGARGLTRAELLTVYCIVLVGGSLMTKGILGLMLPNVISLQYYAHARPAWETTFLSAIPNWFAPTSPAAVDGFFEGRAPVPWSAWWGPLAVWGSFAVALFGCELSLILLFRQQWIRNERLSFPMAQVPLETVQSGESGPGGPARIVRSPGFWIGLGAAFGLTFLDHLSWYVPSLPTVPIYWEAIPAEKTGLLAAIGQVNIIIWPSFIAIAYLIPKDISLSCWVFWFVRVALTMGGIAAGGTPQPAEPWSSSDFPAPPYQGAGALLALGVWAVLLARPHLTEVLKSAWRSRSAQDAGGGVSYRWVLLLFAVSFGYLLLFFCTAGTRLGLALLIVGLTLTYHMVWAKMRAETGIGFNSLNFPVTLNNLVQMPFGSSLLRKPEIIALYLTRWSYMGGNQMHFEVVSGNAIEGLKIADSARVPARPVTIALAVAFVMSLGLGACMLLRGMYPYGFLNTGGASGASGNGILEGYVIGHGEAIYQLFTTTEKPDTSGLIAAVAGAAAALVIGSLRLRFWWWPLHPVGYMLANLSWGMNRHYLQFFVGWVAKTSVLRWGGLRLYRRTMPIAVGVIIGDQLNSALWGVLSVILKRWV
jgi:hypothetical protein